MPLQNLCSQDCLLNDLFLDKHFSLNLLRLCRSTVTIVALKYFPFFPVKNVQSNRFTKQNMIIV